MLHLFVVNPLSVGKKKLKKWEAAIKDACTQREVRYEIYCTRAAGDGARYAEQKAKEEDALRLYACGGDGTVGELAGVAANKPHLQLSCLPFGTGNDFIRNFGKKQDFFDIAALLDGEEKVVDAISWNGNICANIANIGFDRDVVIRVAKLRRFPFMTRSIAYTIGLMIELFRFSKEKVTISLPDGEMYEGKVSLALAANGQFYGGGYRAAGKASLTDGKMDVLVVRPVSRLTFLTLVGDYKNGKILENKRAKPYLIYRQTDKVTICKDTPLYLCVDGEVHKVDKVDLEILPRALRFVSPTKKKPVAHHETITANLA